jgi:Concanavalin A-like lectin/glucanases superfamily/Family of unknown function (DUF6298)
MGWCAPEAVEAADINRIQPYEDNVFYWQHYGQPVVLLGGSDDDNLFQWTGSTLTDHLDLLVSAGGNYLRNTMSDRDTGDVYAFEKVGDFYDLDQWNDEYWNRLDNFLSETHQRNIIVQIELWDGWDLYASHWDEHPWNPKNNSNYTSADTGIPEVWLPKPYQQDNPFVRTVPALDNVPSVLYYQNRFVRKVLERSLQYNHVLFMIHNESAAPHEWSDYWANFLHTEAALPGEEVEVSDMRDNWSMYDQTHQYVIDRPELYTFFEISQNSSNTGQSQWDGVQYIRSQLLNEPRPINETKLYIFNTSYNPITDADRKESTDIFWRNLFGGVAATRFHRRAIPTNPSANRDGHGLNETAQIHIRSGRMLVDAIDIFSMEPHNDLLTNRSDDEAYALAELGEQYAVYFVDGGSVTIDLTAAPENMVYKWLDVGQSSWGSENSISGGSLVNLQTPASGQWAIVMQPICSVAGDVDGDCEVNIEDLYIMACDWLDSDYFVESEGPSTEGLVGHWKFDETTGLTALDSSIGGHNGTLENFSGDDLQWVTGQLDGALKFDGTSEAVDHRVSVGTFDVTGTGITLAAWIWSDRVDQGDHSFGAGARIISKAIGGSNEDHYWMLSTDQFTTLRFRLNTDDGSGPLVTALMSDQYVFGRYEWTHVAATWDGSMMRIYKNGNVVASVAKGGTISTNDTVGVAIGNQPAGAGSYPWDGMIDDVRIYDNALSETEIEWLMELGGPPIYVPLNSPADLYEDGKINLKDFAVLAENWLM